MNFEQIKQKLADYLSINQETSHVVSMGYYLKNVTVKEFFEILENTIITSNK